MLTRRDLKHFSKVELLEMLLVQSKRVEDLEAQVVSLENDLASRAMSVELAGDLANACLQVNGVFRAAQAAADQYLENIKYRCERQLAEAEAEAARVLRDAQEKADWQRRSVKEAGEKGGEVNEAREAS